MSDNINQMNNKQLRNEVQLLRDELAIMKRKFEDIIYNLDTGNFSSRFTREQKNMKSAIEFAAEGIKTKVSKEDLDNHLSEYTTLEQTAKAIKTQAYASADLSSAIEISNIGQATDKTKTYYIATTDENGESKNTYYYYNEISKEWEEIKGGGIDTVFEQTPTGFKLKGNVKIDGSCVLTDSLVFDSSDNPLQVEYSVDGINNWHTTFAADSDKFMRLKIGAKWSDAMKVVAVDGKPGSPGDDATVTPEKVFDILSQGGTVQGIFPAFYDGGDKIFINAEYIKTGILSADRVDTENLSCTRLYAKNNYNGYFAKLNGNLGDFGIFNSMATDDTASNSAYCMFGIYNTFPNVNLYIYGYNFLGFDTDDNKMWTKGTWDFSACDNVLGLDKFVSGGSGGTAVAVFG